MAEKIITIITPVYNKAPYIKDWAEGLSIQGYLDRMKISVTDDGSTDDSLAQIKKYSAYYNLPVEITCNEKNMGLMYTILNAYRKIDTKYFAVLDADDFYVSPQKIEKAVQFLEKNSDYSAYACNCVNIYPNNETRLAFGKNLGNRTYSNFDGAPFFQTASTTFRNFFNAELLNAIDKTTEGHRKHAFQGDGFRNLLAFHFGKFYFENSLDCAWRKEIGIWGITSKISQDIANMKSYYIYYDFLIKQFGYDDIAQTCLGVCLGHYERIINTLRKTADSFLIPEYKLDDNFDNLLQMKDEIEKIFGALLDQYKIFAEIKLKLDLEDRKAELI